MSIGRRIAEAREEKGLTQEELAAMLGISAGTLSRNELDKARPRAERLEQLAKVLDVSVGWLLTGDHPTTSSPVHDHEPSMKERAIFAMGKLTDDERRFVEEQYELVARNLGDSFIGPIVSFLEGKLRERRDQERDRPA